MIVKTYLLGNIEYYSIAVIMISKKNLGNKAFIPGLAWTTEIHYYIAHVFFVQPHSEDTPE